MNRIQMFVLASFFASTNLVAQQATVTAGGDASGAGGTASYSLGQVVYTVASGTTGTSSQGVQQPYEILTGISTTEMVSLEMEIFPNPATTTINLKVSEQDLDQLSFELYNATGQLILNERVTNVLTIVPMQELASGTYFLKVQNDTRVVKTFSVIKNH